MGYDGAGTFEITTPGQPASPHTTISSTFYNALVQDLANGLSNAICKDGQSEISANIPFNNKKITVLAPATARTDAASLANVQDGTGVYVGTVGGTADAITLSPSPGIAAYTAGQTFRFLASGANTTTVTVQVSGLAGPKAITKNGSTALAAGDIPSGAMVTITYDGTQFILGTVGAATVPAGAAPKGAATASSLTMATARLLGRTTASSGAIEEISVGASLTLSSGSLSGTASSDTQAGVIELATQAEVNAMTDTGRALTPNHIRVVSGTAQALSGLSEVTFSSLPAGLRRITIGVIGASINGTAAIAVRLGTSGGLATTGYVGSSSMCSSGSSNAGTTGMEGVAVVDAGILSGTITLTLLDPSDHTWGAAVALGRSDSADAMAGGYYKTLSAELDRVRIYATSGAFDAGRVNISYER